MKHATQARYLPMKHATQARYLPMKHATQAIASGLALLVRTPAQRPGTGHTRAAHPLDCKCLLRLVG